MVFFIWLLIFILYIIFLKNFFQISFDYRFFCLKLFFRYFSFFNLYKHQNKFHTFVCFLFIFYYYYVLLDFFFFIFFIILRQKFQDCFYFLSVGLRWMIVCLCVCIERVVEMNFKPVFEFQTFLSAFLYFILVVDSRA